MNEYTLSPATAKLLKLHKKVAIFDVTTVDTQELDKFNRSEIKNRKSFKKLYKPVSHNISMETFIIPVTGGNTTGYLFKKRDSESSTLIIYYHEGGWMLGNMECCKAICSNICKSTNSAVFAVDYRLSPTFKFPIPVEDCYSAFVWAEQGARYWKIDPQKIFLMGSCTGANLAIAVSRLARDRKGPKIAGLILEDPLTDCRLRTNSMEVHKNHPLVPKKDFEFFIQNYQRESRDILNPLFSPLLGLDHSRLPQTLIFSSELSPLTTDANLYAGALNSADTPVKLITEKNKLHSFMKYPDSDRYDDEMAAIYSFLDGKTVINIELLTKKQRKKLKRIKPAVVSTDEDSQ